MAADTTAWLESFELIRDGARWTDERLCYNATIDATRVRLRGRLSDPTIQQVQVNHLVGGRAVFLDVVSAARGSFELPLRLHRGPNELVFSPFDASGRTFGLRLVSKGLIREWVETLVCAVIFALIIKTFVVQPFYIPSQSMEPTLKVGDRIMVNRFDFLFRSPSRRDVMVFEFPRQAGRYFIKRVIGEPGDRLEILDKRVYVGGRVIDEPYVAADEDGGRLTSLDNYHDLPPVPGGSFFVMGDNRDHSADSRSWGPVPRAKVVGRAAFVWYPLSRIRWIR